MARVGRHQHQRQRRRAAKVGHQIAPSQHDKLLIPDIFRPQIENKVCSDSSIPVGSIPLRVAIKAIFTQRGPEGGEK